MTRPSPGVFREHFEELPPREWSKTESAHHAQQIEAEARRRGVTVFDLVREKIAAAGPLAKPRVTRPEPVAFPPLPSRLPLTIGRQDRPAPGDVPAPPTLAIEDVF